MVTSEDENYENQKGVLINKGWIPHEKRDLTNRQGFEDSFSKQTVIGIVTKGEPFVD
jgi:cytochrome oxidase assembly protein ShyY1